MKNYNYLKIVCVLAVVLSCLMVQTSLAQKLPANALELRLDHLLAKMTMQEKIEQLYYLTDGNDRLKIPRAKRTCFKLLFPPSKAIEKSGGK